MADLTFAQLMTPVTKDQIRERLIARLNRDEFPITDFHTGAVVRTMIEMLADVLEDLVGPLAARIAKGGAVDEADLDWLLALAPQNYNITPREASFTTQRLLLTTAPGVGPYPLVEGDLVAEADSGNRYMLAEAGTIPLAGSVSLLFQAESPGSQYSDPSGTITKLATPLPGVSVLNAAPVFSDVSHAGDGLGTLTLAGTPPLQERYSIKITATGQANAATFSYSRNGELYIPGGICASAGVVLPGGVTVSFVNGATNPSFIEADTYIFSAPGTPVVAQGADAESRDTLASRIKDQWTALSEIALDETYERWARAASTEVTKVTVTPANSAATPGRVEIVIAGAVNPLVGAVGLVQAYIDERHPITDHPVVLAATVVTIEVAGMFMVTAADLERIQTAADLAWQEYLAGLPMGGIVRAGRLVKIIMGLGAVDFVPDVQVGTVGDPNHFYVQLATAEVAQVGAALATELTWQIVNPEDVD